MRTGFRQVGAVTVAFTATLLMSACSDSPESTSVETVRTAAEVTETPAPAESTASTAGTAALTTAEATPAESETTVAETTPAESDTTEADSPTPPRGGGGFGGECTASGAAPAAAPAGAVPGAADAAAVDAGVTAAQTFLSTLAADVRTSAMFAYGDLDAKRCSWSNFPSGIFDGRVGVRMGDLNDAQRTAALAVVESLMSGAGYAYATSAIAGDQYLADAGESNMGEDNYYLAFYGEPSADTPWTMQFGGHHLAIHISVGGGTLSVSPYFQGLQPLSFELEGTSIEAMSVDADHMFGIFESMGTNQLAAAELAGGYDDLVMGPGTDTGYPASEGVAYTDLSAAQQELVRAAITDWVSDAAPGLAAPFIALYESQLEDTRVGWASSIDRDNGAYMRIDGPQLWIEWVNTTAGGGLHYHTIYRDKLVDYGTGAVG